MNCFSTKGFIKGLYNILFAEKQEMNMFNSIFKMILLQVISQEFINSGE